MVSLPQGRSGRRQRLVIEAKPEMEGPHRREGRAQAAPSRRRRPYSRARREGLVAVAAARLRATVSRGSCRRCSIPTRGSRSRCARRAGFCTRYFISSRTDQEFAQPATLPREVGAERADRVEQTDSPPSACEPTSEHAAPLWRERASVAACERGLDLLHQFGQGLTRRMSTATRSRRPPLASQTKSTQSARSSCAS